jgi:hypothetical protein
VGTHFPGQWRTTLVAVDRGNGRRLELPIGAGDDRKPTKVFILTL